MAAPEVRRLRLWQDRVETEVEIAGNGPPLVYLHGPWGLRPDREFIARLSGAHRVYALKHPGTSRGDPEDGPHRKGTKGEAPQEQRAGDESCCLHHQGESDPVEDRLDRRLPEPGGDGLGRERDNCREQGRRAERRPEYSVDQFRRELRCPHQSQAPTALADQEP